MSFDDLLKAVKAGRVAHTGFLEPSEAAVLASKLRDREVGVHVSGGYPGAKRRVLTVFPEHIPEADTPLTAWYFPVHDPDELRVALRNIIDKDSFGDVIEHQDGLSVIVLEKSNHLLKPLRVKGQEVVGKVVPLEKVSTGTRKKHSVIVPSLRIDALGAKAFGVSRSYFAKGIAAGNVMLNGERAGKSSDAEAGDEIYADGLGRFYISQVQGETRKGNLKVVLEVEKA
jgi:RNA-binding protein YlmH